MMRNWQWSPSYPRLYLFDSRFLTHALFWSGYYILFSLIWMKQDAGYFASFYLEFILMPVRILAAYTMLYMLIPNYLVKRRYRTFFVGYGILILTAGLVQMLFSYFFFSKLMPELNWPFELTIPSWTRNIILINTTVLLLGTAKVFQLYIQLREQIERTEVKQEEPDYIEVKADRRVHRLRISDILYLEGMGNYVTYHLLNGQKKMVYVSLKEALNSLPASFLRIHRSYVVNTSQIESYNSEQIFVEGHALPRGKDVSDQSLTASASR